MADVIRIELDATGHILELDASGAALLGVHADDVIGGPLVDLVNENDRDRLGDILDVTTERRTGGDATVTVRLVDREGRSTWVRLSPDASPRAGRDRIVVNVQPFRRSDSYPVTTTDPDSYHALVQGSADIVMRVDPEGTIRFVNTAMVRLLGMDPETLVGSQVLEFIHPDDHDALTQLVIEVLEDPGQPRSLEFRARHADGTYRWIDGWLQNLLDHPAVGGLLGNGRDVTEQHHAQAALAASEERFRSLASSSPSAIFEVDGDGSLQFANDRWRDVTGRSMAESRDVFDVLVPDDAKRLRVRWAVGANLTGLDEEVRVRRPDGTVRWVELHTRPVTDSATESMTHVGSLHDVTEIREAHSELEFLATHDPLTQLPNRTLLRERLDAAVVRVRRPGELLALLFVDLDRFKVVNDSLGHHAGDEVLLAVTARLESLVRPGDLVARFGGDEFVVLCDLIAEESQAVDLADRIRREVSGGVAVDGEMVYVSVSVGVVIGDADSSAETLLRDADAAMYVAKTQGRDRAQVFDEHMHRAAVDRLSVETGLRRGLEHDEFCVYFQPIVAPATGVIAGVEALVRWQHPERGLLEPADFLDVAEESGVLRELAPWILDRACREAAAWPSDGAEPPALFVNLTAAQIANRHLARIVDEVVAATGFTPSRLVLEVTEGMLMTDANETAALLGTLRDAGVRIAIDDFGTGYSSLSYLTQLPVDVLKIDQRFVAGLAESSKDRQVTGAVIALAHALGLSTVAEGVENRGQLDALVELECDLAQGFLFSEPIAGSQIPSRLGRSRT